MQVMLRHMAGERLKLSKYLKKYTKKCKIVKIW